MTCFLALVNKPVELLLEKKKSVTVYYLKFSIVFAIQQLCVCFSVILDIYESEGTLEICHKNKEY